MDNERFTLKPARKRDFWVATDNDNGISITFREHDFNNSQEVNLARGDTSMSVDKATKIATYLREIADWLRKEHYDIAMPSLLVQRERIGQAIRSFRQQRGMTQQESLAPTSSGLRQGNTQSDSTSCLSWPTHSELR